MPNSNANDYMVGGDHYRKKGGQQHWDRVVQLFGWPGARAYFVGNVTAYVERYAEKDGIKDLEKAIHYLQKLIELEREHLAKESSDGPEGVSRIMQQNRMPPGGEPQADGERAGRGPGGSGQRPTGPRARKA